MTETPIGYWRSRLGQHFTAPERKRLKVTSALARLRIEQALAGSPAERPAWAMAAVELLDKAEQELPTGDIDAGWKYLHEAERYRIASFSAVEVRAASVLLANEAETKLEGWRKTSVGTLLKPLCEGTSPDTDDPLWLDNARIALTMATQVRDEHAGNIYFKMRLHRRQMALLSGILFLLLVAALLVLGITGGLQPVQTSSPLPPRVLLVGILFGGIGACLSGLISFASANSGQRVPERLANVTITATRPLIGAASGLAAVLLIDSGLLPLARTSEAILVIAAFAFGFSERLVVGALEKVSK